MTIRKSIKFFGVVFFVFFGLFSNCSAEITAEIIEGVDIKRIERLYENDEFIGTLEYIRVGSSSFRIRICDTNGIEIKRSGPVGQDYGSIMPIYNDLGYIEKYYYFGILA